MNSTKRIRVRWLGRGWKTCLLGVAAVPLALSLSLSVSEISEAYGCSGSTGFGGTGVVDARFNWTSGADQPIPVDQSGFFSMTLFVRGDLEQAASIVSVRVTDADGQPVSGALTQLYVSEAHEGLQQVTLGWTASAELELGHYDATLMSPLQTPQTAQLRVVDARAEPQTLPLRSSTLKRVIEDSGSPVICRANPSVGGCRPTPTLEVGGETRTVTELAGDLTAPELPVAIAWELKVREVPGKGTLVPPKPQTAGAQVVYARYEGNWNTYARFTDSVAEYCVDVETRDLRTDNTAVTRVCAAADAQTPVENWDGVSGCAEPTPELKDRWCQLPHNSSSTHCASTNPGTDPPAPGATPPVGSGDDEVDSGSEGGCSVALGQSRGPAPLTLLGGIAALAALSLRRRRQRGLRHAATQRPRTR